MSIRHFLCFEVKLSGTVQTLSVCRRESQQHTHGGAVHTLPRLTYLRCARAGLNNPGAFAIGDTLHTGPPLAFPAIPCFSPELFAYLRCTPGQKKAFLKGLEGAHLGQRHN